MNYHKFMGIRLDYKALSRLDYKDETQAGKDICLLMFHGGNK
jgi:hypothetical protein